MWSVVFIKETSWLQIKWVYISDSIKIPTICSPELLQKIWPYDISSLWVETHTHTHPHRHMCVCICINIYVCIDVCMYVYICKHTYISPILWKECQGETSSFQEVEIALDIESAIMKF